MTFVELETKTYEIPYKNPIQNYVLDFPNFPTFPVDFPKIFFHTNLVLKITNKTKKQSAKSVKPFSSDDVTYMRQFIFIYIYVFEMFNQ